MGWLKGFAPPKAFRGSGDVRGLLEANWRYLSSYLNSFSDAAYSFIDGSKSFTSAVSGQTPTLNSHLATKEYVDDTAAAATPIVEAGQVRHTDIVSVGVQTYTIVATDTVSGLDASKTYEVIVHGTVVGRPHASATNHRFQVRIGIGGTYTSATLGTAPGAGEWASMSDTVYRTVTGVTSVVVNMQLYSYDATYAGDAFWRDIVYEVREKLW